MEPTIESVKEELNGYKKAFWAALVLLLVTLVTLFYQKTPVALPATPLAVAPITSVNPTENGGKLILARFCTLNSDGTAKTIESQNAYVQAQADFRKGKLTKAMLEQAAEAAKPRPAHEVIAEIPESILADGVNCDAWRHQRAYELVLGAPKPKKL